MIRLQKENFHKIKSLQRKIKRFDYIGKQETNRFEKDVQDAVSAIWSKSGTSPSNSETEAPFSKFMESFCNYFNDPEVLEKKPLGDKIGDEEVIRKYLFLTLTNKSNLNDFKDEANTAIEANKEKFEKFMALYGKGLLEYRNDKKK